MNTPRDAVAHRLCGRYLFFPPDVALTPCDVIALVELDSHSEAGYLKDYYAAAVSALVKALRLRDADAMRTLLLRRVPAALPHQLSLGEAMEVMSLGELRRAALGLYRRYEGVLIGGPFLKDKSLQDRAYQPSLRQVAAWWPEAKEQTARGVRLIDQALCAMAGWDITSEVPFKTLRREFGYPDPAPVYDRWAESF